MIHRENFIYFIAQHTVRSGTGSYLLVRKLFFEKREKSSYSRFAYHSTKSLKQCFIEKTLFILSLNIL